MATKATHHKIKITHKDDAALPPQPMPTLQIGDTVQYFSTAGAVTIEFHENGTPYLETEIADQKIVTVVNSGTFRSRCFIKLKGTDTIIGWSAQSELSGADHDVPKKMD